MSFHHDPLDNDKNNDDANNRNDTDDENEHDTDGCHAQPHDDENWSMKEILLTLVSSPMTIKIIPIQIPT
eukprot:CAMPEP_0194327210 /NCGR_PEP_ID=MMETSP0171-20130528/40116_1 /TAXON_ID=218684 /ORGANISM="Corethron pennatum, Strain L29A3" /LENGTH=69 /DNA_ID=CAMNT_0039087087 /DNA_START=349 /DNA_END=558 /DNA_ORIENTATION=-